MSKKMSGTERVAKNIISTYGYEKFVYLINQFQAGTPGPEISKAFGVTRQRVNQWKKKLGVEHVSFVVNPEIELLLNPDGSSVTI